ncbi:MAG: filamentous hemagglutinin N-terminal domain-containing protein [Cyanobacteria bacterium J06559_3]
MVLSSTATFGLTAPAWAQITPDVTLGDESSIVTPDVEVQGVPTDLIEGGAQRGSNLFHSFVEFNVGEGQRVYFANPDSIESILSRVTGGDPSNIFGTLGVDGPADLFLLNPNGIVFGENASLDVSGSFYATTADAIPLGTGVFSAGEPHGSSLLTVAPEVSFFNYLTVNSGDVIIHGNLAVGTEQTLALAGNTVLHSGSLTAPRGTVQVLGSRVGLTDLAIVDVSSAGGGGTVLIGGDFQGQGTMPLAERTFVGPEVVITADALEAGDGGQVIVWADEATQFAGNISAQGGIESGNGGFVEVSGLQSLTFTGEVNTQAPHGEAGQLLLDPANILIAELALPGFVTVQALDLSLEDFLYGPLEDVGQNSHLTPATVESLLFANDLTLEATETIAVRDDVNAFSNNDLTLKAPAIGVIDARLGQSGGGEIVLETPQLPGSFVRVDSGRVDTDVPSGTNLDGGDVIITTQNLIVENNGIVGANTFGQGNAGQVAIAATGTVFVDGEDSFIASGVGEGAVGNSGGVSITTDNLAVLNNAAVSTSILGEGDAGRVAIAATGNVIVDGENSIIGSRVGAKAAGDSGGVSITADALAVRNNASVSANTFGEGDAGRVAIAATGTVIVDGEDSFITSQLGEGAVGDSGGVSITADNLAVFNNASVSTNTVGQGNAGQVAIEVTGTVIVDGENSIIDSRVGSEAVGNSGGVSITADDLAVLNNASVRASTLGQGNAGQVAIEATGTVIVDGEDSTIDSRVGSTAVGNSGGISITADGLAVLNDAVVSASSLGRGNAGQVAIATTGNVVVDGEDSFIISEVGEWAVGDSGGVSITADNLAVRNNALVSANTFGEGDAGRVAIAATGNVIVDGEDSIIDSRVGAQAVGNSGGISITADALAMLNNASVSAGTFGEGNAGSVAIAATGNVIVDGEDAIIDSRVGVQAVGNSGGISITADALAVRNNASVSASTFGQGNAGRVAIAATGDVIVDGEDAFIDSQVGSTAVGNSGGISITADALAVRNNASVSASTLGQGNAGPVAIEATGNVIVDGESSFIDSQVGSEAVGNSGGVSITTDTLAVLDGGVVSTLTAGNGTAGPLVVQSNSGENLAVLLSEESTVNAVTASQNRGGDLTIISDNALTIRGPGELSVEGTGSDTGAAGSLNIFADSVRVDDGVELSAQTASFAGGGNINFSVNEGIVLRGGSFLNAESTNDSPDSEPAGNIMLEAGFVFANPDENSDIIANAVGGDGGNIFIEAFGVFGLTEQMGATTDELRANDSSDISASSQAGQQGIIALIGEVDLTSGLDDLPENFVDADELVASSCIARSDDTDGSFVVTGNGGLAQQPGSDATSQYPTGTVRTVPDATATQTLQEPQGIYQLMDGRLVLSHECRRDDVEF